MSKEIKDRLDKLESELKESKNEIHNLKSSASFIIERGVRKLLSRFSRKQIIIGSVIALFSISIIGIAATVTKTHTFSSGEVVSASKFNTNFDTLFTLVNGNLDDNNISGISGSKITSGTVAAARIDNLDGSKITSGTVAAARIDNLSASMITSGVFDNSTIPKPADSIVFFATPEVTGNLGGRSGADQLCKDNFDNNSVLMFYNNCSNVRAFISVDSNDEIRDMPSNYGVPTNRDLRGNADLKFGTSWDNITSESFLYPISKAILGMGSSNAWGGTDTGGALSTHHCTNFTDASGGSGGKSHVLDLTKIIPTSPTNGLYKSGANTQDWCHSPIPLICICY